MSVALAASPHRSLTAMVARGTLAVGAVVFALMSVARTVQHVGYLVSQTVPSRTLDAWAGLSVADIVISVASAVASWWSLKRRAYGWTLVFILAPLVVPFVMEANRCEVERVCRALSWALLPHAFWAWTLRLPF